jgi:hypothetical protein
MEEISIDATEVAGFREVYPPLAGLTRSHIDTRQAAFYLNRETQTLRRWACFENGPIRPVRVHSRLAWPVQDIRRLLQTQ